MGIDSDGLPDFGNEFGEAGRQLKIYLRALKAQLDSLTDGILPGPDDQTATEVAFTPFGNVTSVDVQGALEELDVKKETPAAAQTKVNLHVNDNSGAHTADSISFTPGVTISSNEVQSAIEEVRAMDYVRDSDPVLIVPNTVVAYSRWWDITEGAERVGIRNSTNTAWIFFSASGGGGVPAGAVVGPDSGAVVGPDGAAVVGP